MTKPTTSGERLIRIETILETRLDAIDKRLKAIEDHQCKQDAAAEEDRSELQSMKNKGAGILIGVGLAGGAFGATALAVIERLLGVFE